MDMDAHCTSIQKLIDNVNATVPNFMESVTQAKQANCNIAAELRIAKEHMSKLKFNFVEMRTKTGFLEKLCNYEIGSTPSSVISDEAMTEAKTQVKDLKTENTDLQDGIQSIMHDILEQQQHFQTQSEAAKELIQRYAAAQERVQQKRAVLEEQKQQLGGRQQLVSEDQVGDLRNEIEALKQRIAERRQMCEVQKENLASTSVALDATTASKQQLEQEVVACQGHIAAALNHERTEILSSVDALSHIAGIEVINVSESVVEVKLSVVNGRMSSRRHVHITLDPVSTHITQILLDGSSAYSKVLLTALHQTGAISIVRIALALVRQMLSAPQPSS
eukprot:m.167041 g.167041  ORF g.167041 m.167041 type:complete len:334 (-) comp16444_c1_seq4:743-1744(-)